MSFLFLLLKKDLLYELRRKELTAGLGLVTLLLSFLFIFTINSLVIDFNSKKSLALVATWITGLLGGLVSLEKSFNADFNSRVIDRLNSLGCSILSFYISKVIFNFFALLFAFILAYFFTHSGLNLTFKDFWGFLFLAIPVSAAIASLLSLLAGITYNSRLPGLLLIILALPLLVPLFAFTTDLSMDLAYTGSFTFSSLSYSYIIGLLTVYFLLGINLADYVYKA